MKAATKLAPVRTMSVCKLELNVALLGARLARFVGGSLTRPLTRRFFWTDSRTVRNWVRAVSAKYQVYVSHRIGEIQTLTEGGCSHPIPVGSRGGALWLVGGTFIPFRTSVNLAKGFAMDGREGRNAKCPPKHGRHAGEPQLQLGISPYHG